MFQLMACDGWTDLLSLCVCVCVHSVYICVCYITCFVSRGCESSDGRWNQSVLKGSWIWIKWVRVNIFTYSYTNTRWFTLALISFGQRGIIKVIPWLTFSTRYTHPPPTVALNTCMWRTETESAHWVIFSQLSLMERHVRQWYRLFKCVKKVWVVRVHSAHWFKTGWHTHGICLSLKAHFIFYSKVLHMQKCSKIFFKS